MPGNVIYIDITNFPIAVERVLEPKLHGRPVVVGLETAARSLVYAVSDEARHCGIYRGMPLYQAQKCCRDLKILAPNVPLYTRATQRMIEVLQHYTPILEPLRYGRAYLDMTGSNALFGGVTNAAYKAQHEIRERLSLAATAGVASNKLVSKVASDVVTRHQETLKDVERGMEAHFLAPLPVSYLPGVRKKVYTELQDLNIRLNRELAVLAVEHLHMVFGRFGAVLHQRARGIDHRPVQPPQRSPEIVECVQLEPDSNDYYYLRAKLYGLLSHALFRLRDYRLYARRLLIELVYSDAKQDGAQQRFKPMNTEIELQPVVAEVFDRALSRRVRVRKLTLRLTDLSPAPQQLCLFEDNNPKIHAITQAMDDIRQRFGHHAIRFGRAA